MIIIGIDPGASGGAVVYDEDEHALYTHKCPDNTKAMSAIINSAKARSWIDDQQLMCAIEKVHAFPTDARSSAFKFGVNFGKWLGILGSLNVPTIEVTPQSWMKDFQPLPKIKRDRKNELKRIASEMFPENKITLSTSDAALIAAWCLEYNKKKES
jgi:hypothetical protein